MIEYHGDFTVDAIVTRVREAAVGLKPLNMLLQLQRLCRSECDVKTITNH
jgi:hypothetical protein